MKRFIAGSTLAAGLTLGALAVPEAAAANAQCADIYDEVNPGDANLDMRTAIRQYATNKLEVHVQILQDGHKYGINTSDDAEKYTERIASTCGWTDTNLVDVVISNNPRAYDVYRLGKADSDISDGDFEAVKDDFVANLKDRSTPYEADVAAMLQDLDPYKAPVVPPEGDNGGEQPNGFDFPFTLVFGALGALVATGLAGARTAQGVSVRRIYREGESALTYASGTLAEAAFKSREALSPLHPDDAAELRALDAEAYDKLAANSDKLDDYKRYYRKQSRVFWPDKAVVEDLAEEMEHAATLLQDATQALTTETGQVQGFLVNITKQTEEYAKEVAELHAEAAKLTDAGWKLGSLAQQIAERNAQHKSIDVLLKQGFIEKPAERMAAEKPAADALAGVLASLPKMREQADKAHASEPHTISKSKEAYDQALKVLQDLRKSYDPSCYKDLDILGVQLQEQLEQMQTIHEQGEALVGVKSYDTLSSLQAKHNHLLKLATATHAATESIHERAAYLTDIQESLPLTLDALEKSYEDVYEFAFSTYTHDVEDETRHKIETAQQELLILEATTKVEQPHYLEVAEGLGNQKRAVQKLGEIAKADRQEMVTLRSSVEQGEQLTEAQKASLQSYFRSHGSDISSNLEGRLSQIGSFSANTSASRTGLREQKAYVDALMGEMENLQEEAQRQVRAAEDRRRREREEEERRRRQMMASSSSANSHISGGLNSGIHSSGGFGGGGHSSGGF